MMMKKLGIGLIAAGFAFGVASAASAQSLNGTTNSTIGSKGAATGTNGTLHSGANRTLNTTKSGTTGSVVPGDSRSLNGTTNSTIGSKGAATGTNGTLHSGANKTLNKTR